MRDISTGINKRSRLESFVVVLIVFVAVAVGGTTGNALQMLHRWLLIGLKLLLRFWRMGLLLRVACGMTRPG